MRLTIILAAILAGCVAAGPRPESALLPPAPSAGEGDVEKWNSYVDLANELEALFLPALNAYLETFGHDPEYHRPAPESRLVASYFLVLMEKPEDFSLVLSAAEAAAGQGAQGEELDLAVRELAPYLKALWTDLGRSRNFHRDQASPEPPDETGELRVRLDSPEELHARIFASYQGFTATYERFREAMNQAGQKRRQEDIQGLRRRGLALHAALLETLDAGQGLQDYLNVRRISGAPPGGPAPEELRPFLDRLEGAARSLMETAARAGGEDLEGLSAEALLKFREQLVAVRAEAAGLAEGGASSPETLARALGRLVDIYNFME
jgi:hypothetical protein